MPQSQPITIIFLVILTDERTRTFFEAKVIEAVGYLSILIFTSFMISPIYQAIRTFDSNSINTCVDERTWSQVPRSDAEIDPASFACSAVQNSLSPAFKSFYRKEIFNPPGKNFLVHHLG